MITWEEYKKALDIIDEYYEQLNSSINNHNKTDIKKFVNDSDCSRRLKNVLIGIYNGSNTNMGYQEKYIEDIDIKKMKRCRMCGKKTIHEFQKLTKTDERN